MVLQLISGSGTYSPTGIRAGIVYFRTYDLYQCIGCQEYFQKEGEDSPITAKKLGSS